MPVILHSLDHKPVVGGLFAHLSFTMTNVMVKVAFCLGRQQMPRQAVVTHLRWGMQKLEIRLDTRQGSRTRGTQRTRPRKYLPY
jgi:hypothetical protein